MFGVIGSLRRGVLRLPPCAGALARPSVAARALGTSEPPADVTQVFVEYCEGCGYGSRFQAFRDRLYKLLPSAHVIPEPSKRTGAFEVLVETNGEGWEAWSKLDTGEPADDEAAAALGDFVADAVRMARWRALKAATVPEGSAAAQTVEGVATPEMQGAQGTEIPPPEGGEIPPPQPEQQGEVPPPEELPAAQPEEQPLPEQPAQPEVPPPAPAEQPAQPEVPPPAPAEQPAQPEEPEVPSPSPNELPTPLQEPEFAPLDQPSPPELQPKP